MRVINIVDEVSDINHGIWHAAIVNADLLKKQGYSVELWYPSNNFVLPAEVDANPLPDTSISTLKKLIRQKELDPSKDVIITHGLWQFPTRWGYYLKKLGLHWVYVPQGMLEPWPLQQKWLKKKIYFALAEKRMARKADLIRAVSRPESINLRKFFPSGNVQFIPNGVKISGVSANKNASQVTGYLFLSRLHHKKNIVALVEAWVDSTLNNNPSRELIIAGPDQGELGKVRELMTRSSNIRYVGTVGGIAKYELLANCDFFVLPSFSEGLPSALLESMGAGLIPIISRGCNLPDVFEQELGIEVSTDRNDIKNGLERSIELKPDTLNRLKEENVSFINEHFSVEAITATQIALFPGFKSF